MKKPFYFLLFVAGVASCNMETPDPQIIKEIVHDTVYVQVNQTDTVEILTEVLKTIHIDIAGDTVVITDTIVKKVIETKVVYKTDTVYVKQEVIKRDTIEVHTIDTVYISGCSINEVTKEQMIDFIAEKGWSAFAYDHSKDVLVEFYLSFSYGPFQRSYNEEYFEGTIQWGITEWEYCGESGSEISSTNNQESGWFDDKDIFAGEYGITFMALCFSDKTLLASVYSREFNISHTVQFYNKKALGYPNKCELIGINTVAELQTFRNTE